RASGLPNRPCFARSCPSSRLSSIIYLQMQTSRHRALSPLETAAWAVFLTTHAALVRDLDRELEAQHGLPLTQYEVLLHLDRAPDRRLRMSELARFVLLRLSGVKRLVDLPVVGRQ